MSVFNGTWLPMSAVKSVQLTGEIPTLDRCLGVEILTNEFESEGILFNDEGLLLKAPYARLNPGDLICIFRAGQVLVQRYDPQYHAEPEIIGKITRTWRDYR